MASIKLIALTDKVGINKAVTAKINTEALATAIKALIEGIIKDKQFIKKELLKDK